MRFATRLGCLFAMLTLALPAWANGNNVLLLPTAIASEGSRQLVFPEGATELSHMASELDLLAGELLGGVGAGLLAVDGAPREHGSALAHLPGAPAGLLEEIDRYERETGAEPEQCAGLRAHLERMALLTAGAGALHVADFASWTAAYSQTNRLEPGTMTLQYRGPDDPGGGENGFDLPVV